MRIIIGLLLGGSLGMLAKLTSGFDAVLWLLIGVITGAAIRSLDIMFTDNKRK